MHGMRYDAVLFASRGVGEDGEDDGCDWDSGGVRILGKSAQTSAEGLHGVIIAILTTARVYGLLVMGRFIANNSAVEHGHALAGGYGSSFLYAAAILSAICWP